MEKEWKSLDTKTCCKILHIDPKVLEGLIKDKNAYEVSVLLSRSKRSLEDIFFPGCQTFVLLRAKTKSTLVGQKS